MAVVYQHRRKDTNEVFYIGIGNENNRPYSKKNRNKHWRNIVNSVGYEVDVLINGCSWEDACKVEVGMIESYGRSDLKLGALVNMTDGGEGNTNPSVEYREKMRLLFTGRVHSEETKEKIRIASTGRVKSKEEIEKWKASNIGKVRSEISKEKIRLSSIGRKHSEETKIKIGLSSVGRKHSDESKKKISEASIGRKFSIESRLKISNANKGKKRPIGAKQSPTLFKKGHKRTPESIAKGLETKRLNKLTHK